MALRQEVKNNARRIKRSKILRKVETEMYDRQSLRGGKTNQTCRKIPHRWGGHSTAFARNPSHYSFFGRGRRPSQRERKGSRIKKPVTTSCSCHAGSGIGIVNVSMHALSNFSSHKSFVKSFSLAGLAKIFGYGNWEKTS